MNGDSDAAAALSTTMNIIATIVGSAAQVEKTVDRADRPLLLAMIKRFIDAQLDTEMLGAEQLCRRFGVSRASLYRMFVPEGGLAPYVTEQRLNIAMRRLVSPAEQTGRLIDLALDLQFSSESTIVRAFRWKFGLTLGEIREKSQAWQRDGGAPSAPDDILHCLSKDCQRPRQLSALAGPPYAATWPAPLSPPVTRHAFAGARDIGEFTLEGRGEREALAKPGGRTGGRDGSNCSKGEPSGDARLAAASGAVRVRSFVPAGVRMARHPDQDSELLYHWNCNPVGRGHSR
ncbi:MAG: AraC family transcriptional regulator [Bradyrhizobium sp.]|uniref:AraC family transcriptional regulator n=1 Tax=Bradyrhizobium sp. TaxID=376 RepID=UPI0029AF060C|nr:AraC family transcriptional regulator [Bradyrhizobium sp.]MDX3970302.1 AraC family transcriptional regulator [Bradyrhizobium sp.]